jgi:hypothetical protein
MGLMTARRSHPTTRRRDEVIKLIVTTRERFPHTPRLTAAMRRLIWRYAAQARQADRAATRRRKRRPSKSD